LRIGKLYRRDTPYMSWPEVEQRLFVGLIQRSCFQGELEEIERWKPRCPFPPQSLVSVMEKWDKWLDKARDPDGVKKPKGTGDKAFDRNIAEIQRLQKSKTGF
jgi:hypothetical protein